MTESAVILIAALRADAAALILVAAAEAADCIVLLARQIGKLSGLRLLLQIMNKIIEFPGKVRQLLRANRIRDL